MVFIRYLRPWLLRKISDRVILLRVFVLLNKVWSILLELWLRHLLLLIHLLQKQLEILILHLRLLVPRLSIHRTEKSPHLLHHISHVWLLLIIRVDGNLRSSRCSEINLRNTFLFWLLNHLLLLLLFGFLHRQLHFNSLL